jgi:hypothetical protein
MPEFEKVEFEFPDEKEAREAKEAEVKADSKVEDDSEFEIVDDTPLKGKSTEENVEPASEEELEQVNSNRVIKRIQQLNRGLNHERQVKEAALKEKEEALAFAQKILEENKKLKGSLSEGQQALIEQAKVAVNLEVEQAKKKFKEAYDSGDTDALLAAQDELTTAKIKADKVLNFKPEPLQEEEKEVKTQKAQEIEQPVPVVKDKRAAEWHENNPWFGKDEEMTSFALGVHQKLVKSGVNPQSDEYYERLNSRVRQVFPDQFAEEEVSEDEEQPRQKKSAVVAPVTRSVAPKKITLTTTQVALAKKLGVPLELYAKQIAEMRKQNG